MKQKGWVSLTLRGYMSGKEWMMMDTIPRDEFEGLIDDFYRYSKDKPAIEKDADGNIIRAVVNTSKEKRVYKFKHIKDRD